MRNTIAGLGGLIGTGLVLVGCGSTQPSASQQAVEQHALVAGTVMTREVYEVPSATAAGQVAGVTGDTRIEAMTVSGTTWKGQVVLRISVQLERPTGTADTTTRCFRYDFDRADAEDANPHAIGCPTTTPLVLHSPPPAPDLSAARAAALSRTLDLLPPVQRLDASRVDAVLARSFPSPATTSAARLDADTTTVAVRYADQCIIGDLPRLGSARLVAAHGNDCRGG